VIAVLRHNRDVLTTVIRADPNTLVVDLTRPVVPSEVDERFVVRTRFASTILKLRASSQVWTEAYPAMEYRRGSISITAPSRPVLAGPYPEIEPYDHAYRIVLFDQRGCGRSRASEPGADLRLTEYAKC
jgi:hypothetical protein